MTPPPSRVDVAAVVRRAAVVLAVVAFAGSWWHVMTFAGDEGQAWPLAVVIATMPEVSVAVCILRLRSGPTRWQGVWAGIVLATSVAFTIRANLGVQVPADPNAIMVAVWPAWAAIGAAGLVDSGARRTAKPATRPATQPASEPAKPASEPAKQPANVFNLGRVPTAAELPVERVRNIPAADQLTWFAARLDEDRTAAEWATLTGMSQRTVERRLAEARRAAAERPSAGRVAGGEA